MAPKHLLQVLAFVATLLVAALGYAEGPRVAVVLDIKGAIGPATTDYVHRGLAKARGQDAALAILRMDTPGGLDSSMREIIQDILSSPVPVVSFVAPGGARAASAGTYILYASHVAAMAPGTNLGAATPVQIGIPIGPLQKPEMPKPKEGEEAEAPPAKPRPGIADKALSDAVAYIRSLAEMRGRNVDWAEKAVREAASLPAGEALAAGVIDVVANDIDDLLDKIDGREVSVLGETVALRTAALVVTTIEPDWRTQLLATITNPNVAYILMIVGIYGLLFEFYSPGAIVPGVVGAISLLLALYAFQVLPVNYAGLGLILLGIGLMVGEAFAPSFGILGIGGVVAFVAGSIMLLETDVPGYGVSPWLIGSVATVFAAMFMAVAVMLVKARQRRVVSGPEQMVGSVGRVIEWRGRRGRARVHGEIWRARGPEGLGPGQAIRVTAIKGLTLTVESEPEQR